MTFREWYAALPTYPYLNKEEIARRAWEASRAEIRVTDEDVFVACDAHHENFADKIRAALESFASRLKGAP